DLELDAVLEQLATLIARDGSGNFYLTSELADPRFRQPFAGHYWQISVGAAPLLRSRSLWDEVLTVAAPPTPETGIERLSLQGPEKQIIYAAVRSIVLEFDNAGQPSGEGLSSSGETRLLLVAGIDEAEIDNLKANYRADVIRALLILAIL